ncbi:FtsW/RodA/SpoVE family cell cycle protein [Synechococcus sp. PCC 6312]|uniref:FtsW/RodA/SpoVE family cell cycle protein n=1 Tax=Synechococcus sp. (strain ATCC 27167 / PCC 6312) TaxID=195253 RepID=UPI00029EDD78|nr:putative peptidoglycan glycosyltransferase FtsW [Synechococcus sp. PCC 6312]AFY59386.1 bacterial cell division membrane protein [Synechococcus sp. PCC 6312]
MKWWQFIPFVTPGIRAWNLEARLLHWLTLIWLGLGLVVLFSASFHTGLAETGDGLYFVERQCLWIFAGWVGFQFLVNTPLDRMIQLALPGFFVTLGLVFATYLPGLGSTVMGATRWINLGIFQLQPSEFLKPFLVLQAAWVFSQWFRLKLVSRLVWLSIFAITLLSILLQPNLSTTALCGMTLWFMALAAGLPYWQMGGSAFLGFSLALTSISLREYQRRRVMSFLDPWSDQMGDGYQLVQSLLAVGSGGVTGAGFGMSQQKLGYLPVEHTDFIFSVFAEETGLVGCLFLLLLLLAYGAVAVRVADRTQNPTKRLIVVGCLVMILLQALINIGVSIGILPTTGLPFPLFSYGGSSMIASLAIAGLLIRAARESQTSAVRSINSPSSRQPRISQRKSKLASTSAGFPVSSSKTIRP